MADAAVLSGIQISQGTSVTITNGTGLATQQSKPSLAIPSTNSGGFTPSVGSTAGKWDTVFTITGSVVSGTPYTINLLTGADSFGNTLAMVHLMRLHVVNQDVIANPTHIIVIGAGTHPVMGTDQMTLGPTDDSVINKYTGYAIVTSSSDVLTITAGAGTVPFSLIAAGRSA